MELKWYLHSLVSALVQSPEEVVINEKETDDRILFEVTPAQEEIKLLVGRGWKTIRSIQSALHVAWIKAGKKVSVRLLDS